VLLLKQQKKKITPNVDKERKSNNFEYTNAEIPVRNNKDKKYALI
jgi:hypothetical protein